MNLTLPPKGDDVAAQSFFQQLISRNFASSVTLTAGATSTTIADNRLQSSSVIALCPTTLNAAAALASTYVSSRDKGSFVLTHANNAQTDRTFLFICGC